jgi:DNA-binding response OmpR family regulator
MTILLVEDEPRIADFIQRGLKAEGYTVVRAPDGESATTMLAEDEFDLVVLDLILPGISGQDVCRQMRTRGDSTPVLMLTALDRTDDKIAGLQLGADDYLAKPFDFDELIARIRAILRRAKRTAAPVEDPRVLRLGSLALDRRSLEVTHHDQPISLTDKERQILQMLLASPDRVHSRERIINAVWGSTEDPLTNIVDVYIARLRKKLGTAGQAIETVRGIGYRLTSSHLSQNHGRSP